MNNFTNNENEDFGFFSKNQIPFEEDYEKIKDSPNKIFEKYYIQVEKTMSTLSYWKGVDRSELIQDSYELFLKFCDRYDPYYEGNFVQFDRYVFRNMIMSLRAGIQKHYLLKKREQPTEASEVPERATTTDIRNANNKLLVEQLYTYLTDQQKQVLQLYSMGYKQHEIGDVMKISQSRVSVIFKSSIKMLRKILNEEG